MNTMAITCLFALVAPACSTSYNRPLAGANARIDSEAVAEYKDSIGRISLPDYLWKHEKRADEPYALAGEDVLRLELITLSIIKSMGDGAFSMELAKLSPRQLAGVAVFVKDDDLGGKYRQTSATLNAAREGFQFRAVELSQRLGIEA